MSLGVLFVWEILSKFVAYVHYILNLSIMATLTIHTDIDCNIYIDTELHGIAKAETNYAVELPIGAYWIKCTNIEKYYIRKTNGY